MLRSLREMSGFDVVARDGKIGKVNQFYFDDASWEIRYLVVDVGFWLRHREVLLPPVVFGEPDEGHFKVDLTKHQVKKSPETNTAKPISRQHQVQLHEYFGWPAYWGYEGYFGVEQMTNPIQQYHSEGETVLVEDEDTVREAGNVEKPGTEPFKGVEVDPHLRSSKEVIGYHVKAQDGAVGDIADFVLDTQGWIVRYAVIDGRSHCEGKKLLVAVDWIDSIHWKNSEVHVSISEKDVCNAPEYDPDRLLDRNQEETLYDYYGKPAYWSKDK